MLLLKICLFNLFNINRIDCNYCGKTESKSSFLQAKDRRCHFNTLHFYNLFSHAEDDCRQNNYYLDVHCVWRRWLGQILLSISHYDWCCFVCVRSGVAGQRLCIAVERDDRPLNWIGNPPGTFDTQVAWPRRRFDTAQCNETRWLAFGHIATMTDHQMSVANWFRIRVL